MKLFLSALLLCICVPYSVASELPRELETIVAAHEQGRGLVHRISLTSTATTEKFLSGNAIGPPEPLMSIHWSWAIGQERVEYSDGSPHNERGERTDLYDWLVTPEKSFLLRNWDKSNPPVILLAEPHSVKATIYDVPNYTPPNECASQMNWMVSPFYGQVRRDLRELLTGVSSTPHWQPYSDKTIQKGWKISASISEGSNSSQYGDRIELYIDLNSNFAIRKIVIFEDSMEQAINGKIENFPVTFERTVHTYHDFGEGILVPKDVTTQVVSKSSDSRSQITKWSSNNVIINDEVSDAVFAFQIPENIVAIQYPPVSPDHQKAFLYGKDGKPIKEITSINDLPRPVSRAINSTSTRNQKAISIQKEASSSVTKRYLIVINVAILASIFIGYLFFRKGH